MPMRLVRRLAAALALVLLMPLAASAQIALKGGINVVDLLGDDVESSDPRPRLAGGAAFDLISIGPVSLAPELYYAQKGADALQTRAAAGEPVDVSLEYVEVPVLLRVDLPLGGERFTPYLAGGPVFGWQLDCSFEAGGPGEPEESCDDLLGGSDALEETLRDHERGLAFGAGFAFQVLEGFGALTLDARYTTGLTRLSEDDDGPDIQNRAFALLLGYRLGR